MRQLTQKQTDSVKRFKLAYPEYTFWPDDIILAKIEGMMKEKRALDKAIEKRIRRASHV